MDTIAGRAGISTLVPFPSIMQRLAHVVLDTAGWPAVIKLASANSAVAKALAPHLRSELADESIILDVIDAIGQPGSSVPGEMDASCRALIRHLRLRDSVTAICASASLQLQRAISPYAFVTVAPIFNNLQTLEMVVATVVDLVFASQAITGTITGLQLHCLVSPALSWLSFNPRGPFALEDVPQSILRNVNVRGVQHLSITLSADASAGTVGSMTLEWRALEVVALACGGLTTMKIDINILNVTFTFSDRILASLANACGANLEVLICRWKANGSNSATTSLHAANAAITLDGVMDVAQAHPQLVFVSVGQAIFERPPSLRFLRTRRSPLRLHVQQAVSFAMLDAALILRRLPEWLNLEIDDYTGREWLSQTQAYVSEARTHEIEWKRDGGSTTPSFSWGWIS